MLTRQYSFGYFVKGSVTTKNVAQLFVSALFVGDLPTAIIGW